jgi:hypothetical protein
MYSTSTFDVFRKRCECEAPLNECAKADIYIYSIHKAPVSRHLFTNNPSQLFQINPLHAYRWPNGDPAATPHSYFKLIHCTLIDGQTATRHRPDARGPQLWSRHVMPAC